jgi:prefoldin beta subunit
MEKTKEKVSQETTRKIHELQILEQNLQNVLLQKQAFMLELNETNLALEELKNAEKEVYKIVGQVMFKTSKEDTEKDLKSKKEILELKSKNLEKQESVFKDRLIKLRDDLLGKKG